MPILNYTTTVSAAKSAAEIQAKLVRAKAQAVLTEYGPDGVLTALSFRIPTAHGIISFRLPANTAGVYAAICRSPKVPKRFKTRQQAANVAWRVLKDWIEAQLAIVEAEMADVVEVFMPYAQEASGRTMYEALRASEFKMLALSNDSRS